MIDLGKPVRTWHEKYYADTTCTRFDIVTNRYCDDPTHQDYQDYNMVDGVKRVDTIPIEWIEEEIRRFNSIGDNAIPKIQQKYYDRAKYLSEMLQNWNYHGHYYEMIEPRLKNETDRCR